jgi:tetratricopeptide (TPR) repeat protein
MLKDFNLAIQFAEKALARERYNKFALMVLAYSLDSLNLYDKALAAFKKTANFEEYLVQSYHRMGVIYEKINDHS